MSALRTAVQAYEEVQRRRVHLGGCIRARELGRPEPEMPAAGRTFPEARPEEQGSGGVAALLVAIRRGETDGPVPLIGRAYRAAWQAESDHRRQVLALAARHPAWPWLRGVRGAVPILAARLLARLDMARAPTISSFWSYCGYATVPAERFACAACGAVLHLAQGTAVPRRHRAARGDRLCHVPLQRTTDGPGVRVAQPAAAGTAGFDEVARALCDLLGASLVAARAEYERVNRRERETLDRERPEWPVARRRATALRKTVKRWLRDLWLVWRTETGLPISRPDHAHDPADTLDPWSMSRGPRPAAASSPDAVSAMGHARAPASPVRQRSIHA